VEVRAKPGSRREDAAPLAFEEINPEKVKETIAKIDAVLDDKEEGSKQVKQKLNYAKKNRPVNLKRYDEQEKQLGNRNSFSKTDPDATFMRMKEDHMLNGHASNLYRLPNAASSHRPIRNPVRRAPPSSCGRRRLRIG
jgi:hypothetical protein